jgi:diguanylate cyclase (GGDEF)-like protein/PAS domain S-box-containing protein
LRESSTVTLGEACTVLLIEDSDADADLVAEYLSEGEQDYSIRRCTTLSGGLEAVRSEEIDVILYDLGLPDVSPETSLESISTLQRHAPLVVLTGQADPSVELEALHRGAEEFLDKQWLGTEMLVRTIDHATERHQMRQRLQLMERAVDSAREGVVLVNMRRDDEPIVYVNRGFENLTGYDREEAMGRNCRFLQGDRTDPKQVADIRQAIDAREETTIELQNQRKDGEWFWNELSLSPVEDESGTITHYVGIQRDVSRRIAIERENAQQRSELQKYEKIVENSTDAVMIKNTDGVYQFVNRRAQELLGKSEAVVVGEHVSKLFGKAGRDIWERESRVLKDGETHTYEETIPFGETERTFLTTRIPYRKDGKIEGIIGVCRDITDRRELRETLRHQAHHDWLTELPNRLSFRRALNDAVQNWSADDEQSQFAVVFVDVDEFKAVNDTYGHAAGDEVLRQVADRLRAVFRGADLVARAGGDEYELLIPGVHRTDVHNLVTSRLEEAFSEPAHCSGGEVYLTASAGIAHSDLLANAGETDKDLRVEELSRAADRSMYDAKRFSGTSVQTSSPDGADGDRWSLAKEGQLRQALEDGEILPHFQPIVGLQADGDAPYPVLALEALARWQQKTGELIMPNEFISLAERTGLMPQLSEQLMKRAFDDLEGLVPQTAPSTICILFNLSPHQLARVEAVGALTKLAKHRAPSGYEVCFEVTESALLDHPDLVAKLSYDGFKVFIDDFGTGYSSFARLREIPVDGLKIDMEFVHGIGVNEADEAIVRTICALGRDLSIPTVGEGVETPEQLAFLRDHGCTAAQGYLIARPSSADDLELPYPS